MGAAEVIAGIVVGVLSPILIPVGIVSGIVEVAGGTGILDWLDERHLRNKVRKRAQEWKKATSAKVTKCWKSGGFNKVDIEVYDDNQNELGEFELQAKEISSDIRVGMVIEL